MKKAISWRVADWQKKNHFFSLGINFDFARQRGDESDEEKLEWQITQRKSTTRNLQIIY